MKKLFRKEKKNEEQLAMEIYNWFDGRYKALNSLIQDSDQGGFNEHISLSLKMERVSLESDYEAVKNILKRNGYEFKED